jgi:Astacin (Peptidase family M12A).
LTRSRLFSPVIAILATIGFYIYLQKNPIQLPKPKTNKVTSATQATEETTEIQNSNNELSKNTNPEPSAPVVKAIQVVEAPKENSGEKPHEIDAVSFRVEDGLAIVDADIVLGEPAAGGPDSGYAAAPKLRLWESSRIPYYIQPSFDDPQRVLTAISMFLGTAINLVPYQEGDEDVIVFENGPKDCRSYLGKVGGKQPIWLAGNCGPKEIAHEIMHALGFIHEQNRTDRDKYVLVNHDNIEQGAEINFELFPVSLMTVSGGQPFDFESIMMYPPTIFSKSSSMPTLQSKIPGKSIAPLQHLSRSDLIRLERAYGTR